MQRVDLLVGGGEAPAFAHLVVDCVADDLIRRQLSGIPVDLDVFVALVAEARLKALARLALADVFVLLDGAVEPAVVALLLQCAVGVETLAIGDCHFGAGGSVEGQLHPSGGHLGVGDDVGSVCELRHLGIECLYPTHWLHLLELELARRCADDDRVVPGLVFAVAGLVKSHLLLSSVVSFAIVDAVKDSRAVARDLPVGAGGHRFGGPVGVADFELHQQLGIVPPRGVLPIPGRHRLVVKALAELHADCIVARLEQRRHVKHPIEHALVVLGVRRVEHGVIGILSVDFEVKQPESADIGPRRRDFPLDLEFFAQQRCGGDFGHCGRDVDLGAPRGAAIGEDLVGRFPTAVVESRLLPAVAGGAGELPAPVGDYLSAFPVCVFDAQPADESTVAKGGVVPVERNGVFSRDNSVGDVKRRAALPCFGFSDQLPVEIELSLVVHCVAKDHFGHRPGRVNGKGLAEILVPLGRLVERCAVARPDPVTAVHLHADSVGCEAVPDPLAHPVALREHTGFERGDFAPSALPVLIVPHLNRPVIGGFGLQGRACIGNIKIVFPRCLSSVPDIPLPVCRLLRR